MLLWQFTTLSPGSTGQDDCVCRDGFYRSEDPETLSQCIPCPEGAVCIQGSTLETLLLLPGRWRASPNASLILECQKKQHCVGGLTETNVDSNLCAPGHTGVLCR